MGLMLAEPGFHTRCFVEWEEYPRQVLIAAQRAGYLAQAPIWDDLTTFDARPFAGSFDTLLAGYPCQPFSAAGQRKGADDPRHLWPHVARVARELGDGLRWIFLENVAGHISLGAETVLRELWDMGFTPAAGAFSAAETRASHERLRWFCVAYRDTAAGAGGAVEDARRAERRSGNAGRHDADRAEAGRDQGAGRLGKPGETLDDAGSKRRQQVARITHGDEASHEGRAAQHRYQPTGAIEAMDDTAGARRDAARIGAASNGEGRECLLSDGCSELADSDDARPQGELTNIVDAEGWEVEARHARHARLRSGAGIFPPGPGDAAAWAAILAASPARAPAVARRDVAAAAIRIASLLTREQAETIERGARGMESAGVLASVVQQAREMVGDEEAFAEFRRMAHGLADRSRALRLLGNGVVSLVAGHAWRSLSAAHGLRPVDLETASEGDGD